VIVVIEGIDGCGKTTVVKRLVETLSAQGTQARAMAFPDRSTPTGRVIDGYLRDPERFTGLDAYAHQALQTVNRLEKLDELLDDDWVTVLSRYTQSSFVYGKLDGLGLDWLGSINVAFPMAELNILLRVDAEVGYRRMLARGVTADQYERRGVTWFTDCARAYDALWAVASEVVASSGTAWLALEADRTPEELAAAVAQVLRKLFRCHCGHYHNQRRSPCQASKSAS